MFPSTHWTLLAMASLNGNTAGRQALEELCRRYHEPIRRFILSRGRSEDDAQDLTQDFILRLMENSAFKRADRLRGRFRTLLLKALVWFLADDWDRRTAAKRGGAQSTVSVEANGGEESLPVREEDAARFDLEWALAILQAALTRVQAEYAAEGREAAFAVLRRFLPGAAQPPTYEEAAAQLGLSTSALTSEIHRMRGRFHGHVRAEVSRTVSAPHEIAEEMAYLRRLLEDPGADF